MSSEHRRDAPDRGTRERGAPDRSALDRRTVLQSVGGAGVVGLGSAPGLGALALGTRGAEFEGETVVRGSVEQVLVIAATEGATVQLLDSDEQVVDSATTDEFGSYVFRDVDPEGTYTVVEDPDGEDNTLATGVEVLSPDETPPQTLYDEQELTEGFNYIEVRDGTTIACQVLLPDESEWGAGPYPAIVDYSGYVPSLSFWDGIDDVFASRGYAVVGVNKRGTTCSGGAFDFVELLQWLDAYDAIETIAAQDWCDGVGMAGKSYPGYMQLYAAATQPPSLDAIVPGHAVGDFYRDVGRPGGMFNQMFAGVWASGRDRDARPGENTGGRIEGGDETCEANQLLRKQTVPLLERLETRPYYGGIYEERSPWYFAEDIEVPTLFVVAWQDEQTTSRVARLIERFDDDTEVRLAGSNGDHFEYFLADVFEDIERFFAYHLKGEIPPQDDDQFDDFDEAYDAYQDEDQFDDFDEAYDAYQDEDPMRIHWELDRNREARFVTSYSEWPPEEVESWELFCQPDGTLGEDAPGATGLESTSYEFTSPDILRQLIGREDGRLDWSQRDEGTDVAFVSQELESDHLCVGSATADLYVRSTASDTDIQVTLSEVRPDGQEMFVQSGWLRASHRAESEERSKPRRPWHTHREADSGQLPAGEFVRMRVEFHPFTHAFREGSRIRLGVDNPGGNRDQWAFELVGAQATNEIGHDATRPSKLVLPLVPGAEADAPERPDCGHVHHQPCRDASVPERGTVTGSVHDGDPLPETAVEFHPEGSTNGRTTTTDGDGTYAASVVAGTYTVTVDTDDGHSAAQEGVEVTADEETELDLEATGLPPVLDDTIPADINDDGLHEDFTGDGEVTAADVQALFDNLHSDAVQDHAWAYNFSHTSDERVTIFDVQALFTRAQQAD